jgi:hypothetical protein
MLEGLDDVEWADLAHAYGSADAVPQQLRQLTDPDRSDEALHTLYGNIFHQGTRYTATPPSIPFVVELAADPGTPKRAQLLLLALNLGLGYEEGFLPVGVDPHEFSQVVEQAEAAMSPEERAHLAELGCGPAVDFACYMSLNAEVEKLEGLLQDEDPDVRRCAAYALAWFPSEGCTSIPLLEERLRSETEPAPMANLLLCLGLLAQQSDHEIDAQPMRDALGHQDLVVRVAAAIALAPSGLEGGVLEALIEGSQSNDALATHGLSWNSGDLAGYAGVVLAVSGREHADRVVPALAQGLEGASLFQSLDLTQSILHLIQPAEGFADVQKLSPLAREALGELQLKGGWQVQGAGLSVDYSGLMRSYGLPDTQQGLLDYLEGNTP